MKVLLTATVQSHICQFHRPLEQMLHAHGCELHVAAADNLEEKNGLKLDFADRIYPVRFSRKPLSLDNAAAFLQLRRILKSGAYDVVHCNTPAAGVITRMAWLSLRNRNGKLYYTAHGFHFYRGAPVINWLLYYPVEKLLAAWTDKVITVNREDYRLAKKRFSTETVMICGVGVDEKRFYPLSEVERKQLRQRMGYRQEQQLILCAGELVSNKNQEMAVRMMLRLKNSCPQAILLLAGNGPKKNFLMKQVHAYQLEDRVQFLGYRTDIERYQQIADLSVSCSRREGLPLNVVEAMMTGHPVIAARNRGHQELIRPGINGWLVDQEDDLAMALYAYRYLKHPELAAKMGRQTRASVGAYSCEQVKKQLEKIFIKEG